MPLFSVYDNGNKLLAPTQALIVPLISLPGSKIKWIFKNHLSQRVPEAFERWAFFHVKGSTRSAKYMRKKKKSNPSLLRKPTKTRAQEGMWEQDFLGSRMVWVGWHTTDVLRVLMREQQSSLHGEEHFLKNIEHILCILPPNKKKHRWAGWITLSAWQLLN